MDKQSRREAIRDYKERKVPQGIFAVRCVATAEVWVGASRNLGQQQNSIWFGLRQGTYPNRALQAVWTAQGGEAAFAFEVLEAIDDADLTPYGRDNLIKARDLHWRTALGAPKVIG